jgi:hypothetical protein
METKDKICIINFATGTFKKGQERLKKSLIDVGFNEDILFFSELPKHWPKHEDVPWGFKVYAFQEAKQKGYNIILWIDSSGIVFRNIEPIINIMKKEGIFAFSRLNSSVGEWSSDIVIERNNLTREDAFKIPEISGFCIGINLKHSKGIEFYNKWKEAADDKISFLGIKKPHTIEDSMTNKNKVVSKDMRVSGHRHDQTIASILCYNLNIKLNSNYVFDIIGEADSDQRYSSYVPFDALIIQNRDIKTENFLSDLNQYKNKKLFNFYKTIVRHVKDFIKFYLIYRIKYSKNEL